MSAKGFIPVLHGSRADRPDEADTLVAAEAIAAALKRLGFETAILALDLDFQALESLAGQKPRLVFNLVEAIRGDARLAPMAAALMERLGLRYTGADAAAIFETLSKPAMKRRLREAGLPVADDWRADLALDGLFIVKSEDEHASYGMDGGSIVTSDRVAAEIKAREQRFGGRFFAERYIEGREFNIALLERGHSLAVLPVPEIRFDGLPEGRPHIVDYAAKWQEDSPAAHDTPRRFGLETTEPALADRLSALARDCWHLFGLRGYARVDFRVDQAGEPFILEVNNNPCLSPDAGFQAAAAEAGIDYDALIEAIIEASGGCDRAARPDCTDIVYDRHVGREDIVRVRQLVAATGMFSLEEIAIAAELVEERLEKGEASGYHFLMARNGERLLGYACWGPTPGADRRHDLYWIGVDPALQGQGLGRTLQDRVETIIREQGGERVYAETSSTPKYAPTRGFYLKTGYQEVARLDDFYRAGDGKVIYMKRL